MREQLSESVNAAFDKHCQNQIVADGIAQLPNTKLVLALLNDCFAQGALYAQQRCEKEHAASLRQPARAEAGEWVMVPRELLIKAEHFIYQRSRNKDRDAIRVGVALARLLAAAPCPTPERAEAGDIKQALEFLGNAMRSDPYYAWVWHCNVAMVAHDAGAPHYEANQHAADFMRKAFNVDTRKSEHFPAAPCRDTAQEDGK